MSSFFGRGRALLVGLEEEADLDELMSEEREEEKARVEELEISFVLVREMGRWP
jgi:hypothetical protein